MTFLMLDVLRAYGARGHCIVNGWENFRITPMAEGGRCDLVGRAVLVPADSAPSDADQDGEDGMGDPPCQRTPAARVASGFVQTHVFIPTS